MEKANSTMAQQIAQAAIAFEGRRTGRAPGKVTVVLTNDTLVITLHGILSPAEKAVVRNSAAPPESKSFISSYSPTRPTICSRRSRGSQAKKCARRRPKSRRVPARS